MNEISSKILDLIKEKNLSYGELSKITGIPKSALHRYATGVTPKIPVDRVEILANAFRVTPEYIMGWEDEEPPLPPNALPVPPQCKVAVIGRVSAGNGVYAYDDILGYEFADERYCNDDYFFLKVVGDSMTPKIEDGDLVLVHKQPMIESGNYAVVLVDNEDGCVKIVKHGKGWIELHSINPYYPVRRFEKENTKLIKIVGKVIEIKRKL